MNGSLKTLSKLAVPLTVTMLSNNLLLLADRLILARFSLDAFNAAVAMSIVINLFQLAAISIASIAEVFVGRANGADEPHKCGSHTWQMIWFSLFTTLIFVPIAYLAPSFIPAQRFGGEASPYLQTLLFAGPLFALTAALSSSFAALGKARLITIVAILTNALNIALDLYFVFGLNMGAKGAAIATALSQGLSGLILLAVFLNRHHRKTYGTHLWQFKPAPFVKAIRIGFPNALARTIEMGAWTVMVTIMTLAGPDHLTVYSLGITFMHIFSFAADGLQKATISIASNLLGAQNYGQISRLIGSSIKFLALNALVLSIPMLIFPEPIIRLFVDSPSPLVMTWCKIACAGGWLYYLTDGLVWAIAGILTAAGDTRFIMIMNGVAAWFFAIVPAYLIILQWNGSPASIYPVLILHAIVNLAGFAYRYRQHLWKTVHI